MEKTVRKEVSCGLFLLQEKFFQWIVDAEFYLDISLSLWYNESGYFLLNCDLQIGCNHNSNQRYNL